MTREFVAKEELVKLYYGMDSVLVDDPENQTYQAEYCSETCHCLRRLYDVETNELIWKA